MTARIVVVGLGPGGADLVSAGVLEAIAAVPVRFVRTTRHRAATVVEPATSFDDLYDESSTIEEVYRGIVERLVAAAHEHGEVLYAVPGSPMVAERTVALLRLDDRVDVAVHAALSFLDLAWARLGIDPLDAGVRLVDGHDVEAAMAGQQGPFLVAQCDRASVGEALKLVIGEVADRTGAEPTVTVLAHLGLDDERVEQIPWFELDRVALDHLSSVWVPELGAPVAAEVAHFVDLVGALRRGCPWDAEQTHASLRRHLLEETYEVLEALDALAALEASDAGDPVPLDPHALDTTSPGGAGPGDLESSVDRRDEAYRHLEEELGDLLFQIVFHTTIASEAGAFTLAEVAEGITVKLRDRHPHVFGDVEAGDRAAMAERWEQAKKAEKGRTSVFDGIPAGLPSLAFATKVHKKAATLDDQRTATESLERARVELRATMSALDAQVDEGAVGAALSAVVELARLADVDPESALRTAASALRDRWRTVEHTRG